MITVRGSSSRIHIDDSLDKSAQCDGLNNVQLVFPILIQIPIRIKNIIIRGITINPFLRI